MDSPVPRVSVVIPCFNQGRFVLEAIDSVLASDLDDIEIIVVNDGSTDPETIWTLHSLVRAKTTIVHQANSGLAGARNAGFRLARAPYILPLDADDVIAPPYLRKAVEVFEKNARVGFVYSHVRLFGDEEGVWQLPTYHLYPLLWENQVSVCSLIRKSAWEEAGGYNSNMSFGYEDWDLWIGLGERGWDGFRIDEPLFLHRRHGATMTASALKKRRQLVRQLRENHRALFSDRARVCELRQSYPGNAMHFHFVHALKELYRTLPLPSLVRRYVRRVSRSR